jgi:hypothetical protein
MSALKLNLTFEQGAEYSKRLVWRDKNKRAVDLTGYTALLQVRDKVGGTVLVEMSTENGGITLGGKAGTIQLKLTPAQTAALTFQSAVYDMYLYVGDESAIRLIEGAVKLSPAVTRKAA